MGRYKKSIMKLVYSNGKLRKFPLAKMWVFRNFSAVALLFYGVPKIQFILFENLKFSFPAFFMIPYPVPTNKAMLSNGGGGLPLLYLLVSSPLSLLIFLAKLANWIYKVYLDTLSARLNLRFLCVRLIARCSLPPVQLLKSPPSILSTFSRLRQRFFVASSSLQGCL